MFELYRDRADEWRWRLRAENHRIIADSGEGYHNRDDCLAAINTVRKLAPGAALREITANEAEVRSVPDHG